MHSIVEKSTNYTNLYVVSKETLKQDILKYLSEDTYNYIENINFNPFGNNLYIADENGQTCFIAIVSCKESALKDFASVVVKLPEGVYKIASKHDSQELELLHYAWLYSGYAFTKYKKVTRPVRSLVASSEVDTKRLHIIKEATFLTKDLINTTADDLGPNELAEKAQELAEKFNASCIVIKDLEEIKTNHPAVYAVGKGSDRKPCYIDLNWGNKDARKVTLVGKGVCYDTGGLNLKPAAAMGNMKKDMGGAAHVLGLAYMIMALNINVNLRVIIPAVENSVSGFSMRQGDIITTKKGLTVEVGHTDAEGRLILADALHDASLGKPDLLIDMATLTGAARVALGPSLPAMMTTSKELAKNLTQYGNKVQDPVWELPLWKEYNKYIQSPNADLSNMGSDPAMAGTITAGLFLSHFVEKDIKWAHFDVFGWSKDSPCVTSFGAESYALRALLGYIESYFA